MTDNKPLSKEDVDNAICEIMMVNGDGHVDGHEKITDFVMEFSKQEAIGFLDWAISRSLEQTLGILLMILIRMIQQQNTTPSI